MKRADLVFVSGPFSAWGDRSCEENITACVKATAWMATNGIPFVCPNLLGMYPSFVQMPYETFIEWVLTALMPTARILVLLPGWKDSPGCRREHARATELGLAIVEWQEYREIMLAGGIP